MIKKTIFALGICIVAVNVIADEQLDRMEAFAEELTTLMYQAMIKSAEAEGADVSKLKTLIPDTSWNEEMRGATRCILDKYEARIGSAGIDKMLDDMEAKLPSLRKGGMEAFEQASNNMPDGITIDEAIEINRTCGMTALQQKNIDANKFTSELLKIMAVQ